MQATFVAVGLLVVFGLLQVAGAVSLGWPVWVVLGVAVGSGVVLDAARAREAHR